MFSSKLTKIKQLAITWSAGTFEIHEEESLIIGFFEGFGAFNPKNSIFIDSPYSDTRLEELEDELSELITDTYFKRSKDHDTTRDQVFILGIEAQLDDPDLYPSLCKILDRSK